MRQAKSYLQTVDVEPRLMGLKSGTVVSSLGKSAPAEALISQFVSAEAERPLPVGLLLAGGAACGQQMLADPRVHLLIQKMHLSGKPVGYLFPVYLPLVDLLSQKMMHHPFLLQEAPHDTQFMQHFAKQLGSDFEPQVAPTPIERRLGDQIGLPAQRDDGAFD